MLVVKILLAIYKIDKPSNEPYACDAALPYRNRQPS